MPVFGRSNIFAAALLIGGATLIPLAIPSGALLAATIPEADTPTPLTDADFAAQAPVAAIDAAVFELPATMGEPAPSATDASGDASAGAALDPETECMAKVVYHESANQPREGQLAVAQTIMNRVASGRFAATPCGVANQKGQFFQTSGYEPPRASAAWAQAVEVAREARAGTGADVAQGAMFFQTASSRGPRARARVTQIGAHVFYR